MGDGTSNLGGGQSRAKTCIDKEKRGGEDQDTDIVTVIRKEV